MSSATTGVVFDDQRAGPLRAVARVVRESPAFRRGRELWEKNQKDWDLPLSRWQKLQAGLYLILKDYSEGRFPPTFLDQQRAYQNEMDFGTDLPGVTEEEIAIGAMRKPFWFQARALDLYLGSFVKLVRLLTEAQIAPPAKLLELGGGSGWTAEFLAQMGFTTISTTIAPIDVRIAQKRVDSMGARGVPFQLEYRTCPMETVNEHVRDRCPFDAIFVYEALHHAFDWRAAVNSAFSCLRPGGWLLLCNEPNWLHTAIAYRVAKLAKTHEIGFLKSDLIHHLRHAGFQKVYSRGKRPHLFFRPHWIMAQR